MCFIYFLYYLMLKMFSAALLLMSRVNWMQFGLCFVVVMTKFHLWDHSLEITWVLKAIIERHYTKDLINTYNLHVMLMWCLVFNSLHNRDTVQAQSLFRSILFHSYYTLAFSPSYLSIISKNSKDCWVPRYIITRYNVCHLLQITDHEAEIKQRCRPVPDI